MEQHINHMYELHKFMQSLTKTSRPRHLPGVAIPIMTRLSALGMEKQNQLPPLERSHIINSILAANPNIDAELPPLAHPQ